MNDFSVIHKKKKRITYLNSWRLVMVGRVIEMVVVVTGTGTLVGGGGGGGIEGGSGSVICRRLPLKGPRPTAVAAATLMRYVVPGETPIVTLVEVEGEGTSTHCSAWAPPSAT